MAKLPVQNKHSTNTMHYHCNIPDSNKYHSYTYTPLLWANNSVTITGPLNFKMMNSKNVNNVPVLVTGVRYNSLLWMCTLNTLTWPDLMGKSSPCSGRVGFLSHYLNSPLPYVRLHITWTILKNVLSASLNKTFPSFLPSFSVTQNYQHLLYR